MADKSFGVKELNLLNASGTPTVTSPNNLNLNANTVAISTSCTIGSNLDVDGTTNLDNTDIVGVTTIRNVGGVKLYEGSGNGSKLFHAGTERLSTETYGIDINGTLGADQINCSGVSTITVPANANPHSSWDVVNNSASSYRFTGPGQDGAEDNPDIYLVRGQRYVFKMNASGHPFQIRVSNGGSAYSDGVTNNGAQTGNVVFNVQHDAPAHLFYQCTSHGSMVGNIYIVGQHLANGANNRVLTATSAYGMNGEAGLTYNGSTLFSHTGTGYKELHVNTSTNNSATLRLQNSQANYTVSNVAGGSFSIADATATRLFLTSSGDVGIGTIVPLTDLHIHSESPRITMSDSGTNAHHRINADSSVGNLAFDIDYNSATSTPAFVLNMKGDEKVRIHSTGQVGINTTGEFGATNNVKLLVNGEMGLRFASADNAKGDGSVLQMGSYGKSMTMSTSAVNVLRFHNFGNGGVEITVFRRDTINPSGAQITKLYIAFGGSGNNITSASIVQEDKVTRGSIHNYTYTITENNVYATLIATGNDNGGELQTLDFYCISSGGNSRTISVL